jgi:anaerobic selenocysteine-containing dehydrogenase
MEGKPLNSKENIEVYRTTVWSAGAGCHGGCGQKLYVKDGKLVKVEGDENHPWNQGRACPRVLALKQYMYHPDRIIYPLKLSGKRGEGQFERISWDEAFDTIEAKFKEIREKHGAEAVLFCQGTGRDIGGPISFLAYNYGSPNWSQLGLSGQSCYTLPSCRHEGRHG